MTFSAMPLRTLTRQRGGQRLTLAVQDQNLAAQALYLGSAVRQLPATPPNSLQPAQEHAMALVFRH
jgi:hypothetical protein